MDKHEELARRTIENDELSRTHTSLPELSPLDQLIAKARIRWPFPEMGKLEYVDWRETLNLYPLKEIQWSLDYLMRNPPKRGDEEYRGRPSLVDVTRTIDILREERASERMRNEGKRITAEMNALQKRKDEGEEFFGLADVFRAANIEDLKTVVKPMPEVKTVWPEIDPTGANAEKLRRQKEALERQERARASAGDRD